MATTTRAGRTCCRADFLAQLERLALLSRRAFRGRVKGERRSPRKGISVEFSDYRPYGIGDDLRYVDWNIYGRLDRLYVKLFVDEEDLCLNLLLDASASMSFGAPSKLAYGARLAAGARLRGPREPGARGGGAWCASASPRAGARPGAAARCCPSWTSSPASGRPAAPR